MRGLLDNTSFRKMLRSYPLKAMGLLYDSYFSGLLRLAEKIIRDPSIAEDVVQDTFLHIWQARETLAKHYDRSIENYLVKVTKYKAINTFKRLQKEKKAKAYIKTHDNDPIDLPLEEKIIWQETLEEAGEILSRLPEREMQCLAMRVGQGMSHEEIAKALNVTKKAVERNLSRVQKRLREYRRSRRGGR